MKTVEIKQVAISIISEIEELKMFLPAIDDIADDKLKQEIREQGIREPLTLAEFDGQTIVLDGHNRLRIAKGFKYTEIPAVFYGITDLTEAKQFMINNQLGKRNLGVAERVLMVLQLEPELAEAAKARKKMKKTEGAEDVQNSAQQEQGRTIEKLAKMAGTSRDTIAKVKKIQATGNVRLLEIANKSVDKAYDISQKIKELPQEEATAIIDEALTKRTEPETVVINDPILTRDKTLDKDEEVTKVSELSYVKKFDDKNYTVISLKDDGFKGLYANTAVNIEDGKIISRLGGNIGGEYFTTDNALDGNIEFLAGLLDNMRVAKRLVLPIWTADAKQAVKDKAKADKQASIKTKKEKEQKKIIDDLLLKVRNSFVGDRDIDNILNQQLEHKDLIKALKQAMAEAERIEKNHNRHNIDEEKFLKIAENYILSEEQLEAVENCDYLPDEKTFELRYAENLAVLATATKKEKAPKADKPKASAKAPKTKASAKTKAKASAKTKKKPTTPAEPAPAKFETNIGEAIQQIAPAKKKAPAKKTAKPATPAKKATDKPASKKLLALQKMKQEKEELKQRIEDIQQTLKSEDKKAELAVEIAEYVTQIAEIDAQIAKLDTQNI